MRVWKIEVTDDEERIRVFWGYAWAETEEAAIAIARQDTSLSMIYAHRKPEGMLWPSLIRCDLIQNRCRALAGLS